MKTKLLLVLCIFTLSRLSLAAETITEIKSKNIVDLLSGLSHIYDAPNNTGFHLKIFNFIGSGECLKASCHKNKIIFATSTFDEYPDKKIFEVEINGGYRNLIVNSVPVKEDDYYIVRITTVQQEIDSCATYKVSLNKVQKIKSC